MDTKEIRAQINSKMKHLDEAQLKMIELFIEKINSLETSEWDLKQYVDKVINERKKVLEKLAQ